MSSNTNSATQVKKFFDLLAAGKQAALDVQLNNGEVACIASINQDSGAIGNGTPGQPYTAEWTRVAACANGSLL